MELVAAAKMRRAAAAVVKTRPYATISLETIRAIAAATGEQAAHPLLTAKPAAARSLFVLFSSDRGLAGGYNVNMFKLALMTLRAMPAGTVDVIAIGKRGGDAMARAGFPVIASFTGLAEQPKFTDILPVGRMVIEKFTAAEYKSVQIGYTDYVSGITQRPNVMTLLPVAIEGTSVRGQAASGNVSFEPSPDKVLDRVLPGLVETFVYQSLLEAAASEHAARMMAMRNASDSATEMLDQLTFTYNQARQAAITQEIAEISSGKAALEK